MSSSSPEPFDPAEQAGPEPFSDADYRVMFSDAPEVDPVGPHLRTEETYQQGTQARADAAARDGLARFVYQNPPSLAGLFSEAAAVLAANKSAVLPGQVAAGRPGSATDATAQLAKQAGVPAAVIVRYLDDEIRRTCNDNVQGHREALTALAAARCLNPMVTNEELPQLADKLLGTL